MITISILTYIYIYYNVTVLYRLHGEMESHSSHIVAGVKEGAYVNLQVRTFYVPFFFKIFESSFFSPNLFFFFYTCFLSFFTICYVFFYSLTLLTIWRIILFQSTGGWTPIIFAASLGTLNNVM